MLPLTLPRILVLLTVLITSSKNISLHRHFQVKDLVEETLKF